MLQTSTTASRRRPRRLILAVQAATVLFVLAPVAPAAAADPEPPAVAAAKAQRQPVAAKVIDLSYRARRVVRDRVLGSPPRVVRSAAVTRTVYVDQRGNSFAIDTDQPGLDTKPFADVLASVIHGDEIANVEINITTLATVQATCGQQALACYFPMPDGHGRIYAAFDDTDWIHTLIHEYGHHMDNQLLNLAHIGMGCDVSSDGSRNWLFARFYGSHAPSSEISCDGSGGWSNQLPELYAEDFAWLNGMRNWVLPTAPPPSADDEAALRSDIELRLTPSKQNWSRKVTPRRRKVLRLDLPSWTFLDFKLRGPRRTNFDLIVFKQGDKTPYGWSKYRGSREGLSGFAEPGTYFVVVKSVKGRGKFKLRIGQY